MGDRICDNCMTRVPRNAEKCLKCGIRFENTNPGGALPNGWVLADRYTVGRYIDIDGEGVSYSAIDSNTLQRVVIKEFMPVTLCASRDEDGAIRAKPGCEVLFKTTRMDFCDLFVGLLGLGLVEGLVQILDVFEENNTGYAVMEKIEGPTLAEYLTKREGTVDATRALALLRPVLNGVEIMHNNKIIHRGICPENIILESGGAAKLSGFATLALRQQGSELKPKLYPGYSAPEQYAASEFEGRYTDIYAICAVLYRLLTGFDPQPADDRKLQDELRNARVVNKEVPTFLSAAIGRGLRVVPAERIQAVQDLRLALSGEGPREAKGTLGLTKQQMIVGGVAAGTILVLLLVVLLISALTKDKKDTSSSSSSSSEPSSVSIGETLPNFVGKRAADILQNPAYTSVFTFATPEEVNSDEVEAGRIISQTPEAGTVWDGKTPILFQVSKGPSSVALPNLVGMSKADATKKLNELNISYELRSENNTGQFKQDEVVRTEPGNGTQVTPGKDKVVLFVAGEVTFKTLPDVTNLSRGDAVAEMNRLGVQHRVEFVSNTKGRSVNDRVQSTEPGPGSQIDPQTTVVVIRMFENYRMPDLNTMGLAGRHIDEVRTTLKGLGIPYTEITVDNTTSADQNGKVQSVTGFAVGVEVTDNTIVTLHVFGNFVPPQSSSSSSSEQPPPVVDPTT